MTPSIISNPEISIRVNQLHKEMKRQGIEDYKLWPSVAPPKDKPRRTGISRAHKSIVQWALVEGLPEVCIMEDDIWFPSENGWNYFLENKPKEDYDLYLGGITRGEIENGIVKRYTGQFCYFIHERFYTTFLGVDENLDIDGAMSGLGKFYVCNPFACFCYPSWSDNVNGMMDYSHLLIGRDVYGFGLVGNQTDANSFSETARKLMAD